MMCHYTRSPEIDGLRKMALPSIRLLFKGGM